MGETTTPWDDMRTPALAIVARGDQIESIGPTRYQVHSQSNPERTYTVEVVRDNWSCDCTFHINTHIPCIHILAVKFRNGLLKAQDKDSDKSVCVKCQSGDVIANGKRYNKSGVITRYRCKSCGYRFTGKDGFQRRRSEPEKIALALDLYFRGMSLRQIVEHFSQVHSLKLSHMTVYRWITHYSKLAADWLDSQDAIVSEKWHVDETVINVNGESRYLWNVMDSETRMLLATHVSRGRSAVETRKPLKKAKGTTETVPTQILTDGMPGYPIAIKREFGGLKKKGDKLQGIKRYTPHKVVPSIRAAESNNIVERLHGTEKSRTKVMRAFDQEHGAAALMDGWRVHYDLIRRHQALGMTPAEAADIPSLSGFKWLELLKLATK